MLAKRRRSILVRSAASEEGPKNPFKGTTVKLLVLASYAQFGVGAERKRGPPRLRIQGVPQWHGEADPVFVETCFRAQAYSHLWYFRPVYDSGWNLYCGATRPMSRERCVQSSLPCVGMADRGSPRPLSGQGEAVDRSLKPWLQKRLGSGLTAVENT